MRDTLTEELFARLLDWGQAEVAQERPLLQALAAYKYDEYQQFSAGSRFIENLVLWLRQFQSAQERRVAYAWLKAKLIFCSSAEMRHFVELAYPDHIRPFLLERVAAENHMNPFRVAAVSASKEFAIRQRQCLFLGLSDGARIDAFRRANRELNHEQIWQTYELSVERVNKLLQKLTEHLQQLLGNPPPANESHFRTLVLLDDFSASGTSYYAGSPGAPSGGKIASLFSDLCDPGKPISRLVTTTSLDVMILLYVGTQQALDHLNEASRVTLGSKGIGHAIKVVQLLPSEYRIRKDDQDDFNNLVKHPAYYDPAIHDEHFEKGGTQDARYGYAACGLPLVLHHNTPNNSVALLMSYENLRFRGLFPRIQRHKEMS